MSLRDDFVAARKTSPRDYNVPWELWPVSGALAVFAKSIPERVKTAIIRAEAGELLGGPSDKDLSLQFEEGRVWNREFSLETLEKIPGYRRLVEAVSDPDNDIAFSLSFKGDYKNGTFRTTIQVTLDPSKPFTESTVQYEDATRYLNGKNWQLLKVGENGIPAWAQKKPKAKLSGPTLP